MRLDDDDFALFGLPRRQRLDDAAIDAKRRELQAFAHPDRHASEGAAARRVAMQWSARINEAHRRLRDPLARASALCAAAGADVDAERNTAMPAEFLMKQMAWREAIDDAAALAQPAAAAQALREIDAELAADEAGGLMALESAIDRDGDFAAAAGRVRALMFVRRLRADVRARRERADDAVEDVAASAPASGGGNTA